jgi:hypothetical protein
VPSIAAVQPVHVATWIEAAPAHAAEREKLEGEVAICCQ